MLSSVKALAALAVALWLPYCLTLWPLPPAEYASLRARLEEAVADRESKVSHLSSESEADRKFLVETYEKQEQFARDFIAQGDEYIAHLWLQWSGNLLLLLFGLAGWTLVLLKGLRAWWIALLSTVGLVTSQLAVAGSTYMNFLGAWAEGQSGFALRPLPHVLAILYFDFLMPAIVVLLTVIAGLRYIRARKGTRGGYAL